MSAATTPSYLLYELTLHSPAIVSTLSGDPNSAATQPFIPGGAIRGVVAARLVQAGAKADGAELRDLVLSGAVRYLHAYPEIGGARSLPAPTSWRSRKHDRDRAHDLAAFSGRITEDAAAEDLAGLWPEESLGAVGAPFVAPATGSGARRLATPHTQARLHQQRDRQKGRPWVDTKGVQEQAHGAIFAYEHLEAEQVFHGAIQVTAPARAYVERLRQLLDRPLLLGRSRRAGYGGEARLRFTGEARREVENLAGALDRDLGSGERFRVLLVSAYVGRHPATGQLDPAALDHELLQRLGDAAEVERRRWLFETVGSFNRKWRLEVPQAPAVAGGAVLVLRACRPIAIEMLRAVEHEGLGERRVEGFGRVAFLEPPGGKPILLERDDRKAERRPGSDAPPVEAQDRAPTELAFLETRIVLAAARAELGRLAADLAREAKRIPTNSLLGRVRTLFRNVRDEDSARKALADLAVWCGADGPTALKARARSQLEKCRLSAGPLLGWLAALTPLQDSREPWQKLVDAVGRESSLTGLAASHHLSDRLAAQRLLEAHAALLSVQLVDTLLATLARRNAETRHE
jgi:CRISPR-associated protein Csx10